MSKKNKAQARRAQTISELCVEDILFNLGFGTRHECRGLSLSGAVRRDGQLLDDPFDQIPLEGLVLNIEGVDWPVREHALLMLHKPAGFECSQKPKVWPSVLSLLPAPLRRRGVQPVGRLDQDTTGVLLLTDDGALIHRLTHPRKHVNKVYDVRCARPVTEEQIRKLLAGVVLVDDPSVVVPAACTQVDEFSLQLTLTEGKYHQVKRMLAAVGNHVEQLHRSAFGPVTVPEDCAPGQWRWVDPALFDTAPPAATAAEAEVQP
ncbi:ribosomal small subunit pseudouridine synthase A [Sphaerotilus hippei]|uniref:Pseudouridine synthase n=1 Tax=Sphaerotilus hippei TaxID=744406 RepID=A0A318HBW2_9BURK|nr:16S rRNA pseudouridine(516) synthase [Sphaerotilus hippei]PXW96591.1 ribosomal small subunit pseudouridine synthase A [Sphaerotilus hippei]